MQFPVIFTRTAAGGTGLNADSAPTGAPTPGSMTNLLSNRAIGLVGWPCHRVAAVYKPPSGSSPPSVPVTLLVWESATQAWYRCHQAPKRLVPGQVTYFDIVALVDPPQTLQNLPNPAAQSFDVVMLIGKQGAAANGVHTFALAPDLTTIGEDLPEESQPARSLKLVSPSDTSDLPDGPCRGLFVTATGTVEVIAEDDPDTGNQPLGTITAPYVIPVAARRVMMTGTSATVLAIY